MAMKRYSSTPKDPDNVGNTIAKLINEQKPHSFNGYLIVVLGIYGLVMLSHCTWKLDKGLLLACSQFWPVFTNSFHFWFGMMAPTFQDLGFLVGIYPHGEEANALISSKSIAFSYPDRNDISYSFFLNDRKKTEGEVTEEEHISFFIYWFNKFIFYVSSHKVTKDFTDLAKASFVMR
ncbi:hypothetical protein ACSBR2_008037 [Camellia fascicularis]